ncbi:hypothetical protein EDB81DRAFT_766373 [Dactylonectria macrodidyma]|uniref:Uncharacterized protein n=1 Tax=Dactylonectria macrodidyma TaxID=307937 RepID=A0A9P9IJC3_9HYPO|nr:hypothetical protein EDB81DRAFT_766373 [Dactylonectria macrodidyma]
MEPNPNPQQPSQPVDPSARPTHQLEDVKVGDYSVQLLLSTKDHLYDAKNIETGTNSWQVIGSWDDASVQELAKMINQRQTTQNRDTSAAAGFGTAYGAGYTLKAPGSARVTSVRPQGSE